MGFQACFCMPTCLTLQITVVVMCESHQNGNKES